MTMTDSKEESFSYALNIMMISYIATEQVAAAILKKYIHIKLKSVPAARGR